MLTDFRIAASDSIGALVAPGTRQEGAGAGTATPTPATPEPGTTGTQTERQTAAGTTADTADPLGTPPGPASAFGYGLALMTAGLALLPAVRRVAGRVFPRRQDFFARWGFSHAAVATIVFLLATLLASLVPGEGTLHLLLQQLLVWLPVGAYLVATAVRCHPEGVRALGLDPTRAGGAAALAGVLFVAMLPVLVGAAVAWGVLFTWLGGEPPALDLAREIASLDGGALWLGLLFGIVVGPFFEELVFRGFLQPLLVQNVGGGAGVLLTSLLFAGLHGGMAFGPLLALSLFLGTAMVRTRRLLSPWLMHATYNGILLWIQIQHPEWIGV